jgi:uncharacterized membrane protein YeaQ/YmgE (transglycosylase-associated protein family)
MGFISWIIIGLIAGWLTGKIMGGPSRGALMDIIVGLIGAFVGGFLARLLGLAPEGGYIYTTLVAVAGAVILTWIFRKMTSTAKA